MLYNKRKADGEALNDQMFCLRCLKHSGCLSLKRLLLLCSLWQNASTSPAETIMFLILFFFTCQSWRKCHSAVLEVIDVLNESLLSSHSPKMSFCTFLCCCFFPIHESSLCYLPAYRLLSLLEAKPLKACPATATSQTGHIPLHPPLCCTNQIKFLFDAKSQSRA